MQVFISWSQSSSREIAKILKDEGYIVDYSVSTDSKKVLSLQLKYNGAERIISGIKRISKPGLRVYAQANELPKVLNGLGIAIISTSQGLMTNKKAKAAGIGGEVIAYVW